MPAKSFSIFPPGNRTIAGLSIPTSIRGPLFAALGIGLLASPARAAEIRLLSAASMQTVLKEVTGDFERASGHTITIRYSTMGAITDRVIGGEPADLVISSPASISTLASRGKIDAASQVTIAKTGVGIIVPSGTPKPGIATIEDFQRALLGAKVIVYANPAGGGAAGIHFTRLIEKLGLAEQLKPKIKFGAGGDVAEVTLAEGDGALGLTQVSEIVGKPGAQFVPLPEQLQNYTGFVAGTPAGAKQPDAVTALIQFLKSPTAVAVIMLAVVQYRWSEEVRSATSIRLADSLQMSMMSWHLNLFRDLSDVCLRLRLDSDVVAGRELEQTVRRFQEQQVSAEYPDLVSELNLVSSDPGLPILRWNPITHRFEPVQVSRFTELQDQLSRSLTTATSDAALSPRSGETNGLAYTGSGLGDWRFDPNLPGLVRPIATDMLVFAPQRGPGRATAGWLVIQLNVDVIRERVLPELANRYFTGVNGLDYQVALVAGTSSRRIIYSSDPSFGVDDPLDAGTAGGLQHRNRPGRRLGERHHRHQRVHVVRVTDAPLQHLHAAHRGADHGDDVIDAKLLLHQAVLRLHHVADGEFRELHARLRLRIARRGRETVRDRIGADDEIFVGVQRLAGADQEIEPVVIARDRRHHQDRVGLLVIELAVGDVGDRKILDHVAAFELEIAFAVGLVRRLLRGMRRGRQRQQQSGGDDVSDPIHSVFSP